MGDTVDQQAAWAEAERLARRCVATRRPLGWAHVEALLGLAEALGRKLKETKQCQSESQ